MTPPAAAIDCGTNSTRLLIVSAAGETLERRMTITRMGDGVDRTHRLAADAIGRTLAALSDYAVAMAAHGVGARRAVATSAARDATNRDEFFRGAETILGVRPELLSGLEEGQLSYRGATADLDEGEGPYLVVDIGGGSTELAMAQEAISLDIGCVRLSERFFHHDPPSAPELKAARAEVDEQLEKARRHLGPQGEARCLVGLAGTVSTAAMISSGLTTYTRAAVHHQRLSADSIGGIYQRLSCLDHRGRAATPGLEPGRIDVIVGGLLILVAVMDNFGFDGCLASESDILDGMAAGLLDAERR
jgi:exopolyphosphatase / guanosine-5'-triphosphate,3'-diphosphate pyrophosphatase